MAQFIDIPAFNPEGMTSNPMRGLGGVMQTGSVTADTYYSSTGPLYARWLYIGVTGNVNYMKWDGTTQLLLNVAAGVFHPIHSLQILSTSTTATNMVWGN